MHVSVWVVAASVGLARRCRGRPRPGRRALRPRRCSRPTAARPRCTSRWARAPPPCTGCRRPCRACTAGCGRCARTAWRSPSRRSPAGTGTGSLQQGKRSSRGQCLAGVERWLNHTGRVEPLVEPHTLQMASRRPLALEEPQAVLVVREETLSRAQVSLGCDLDLWKHSAKPSVNPTPFYQSQGLHQDFF